MDRVEELTYKIIYTEGLAAGSDGIDVHIIMRDDGVVVDVSAFIEGVLMEVSTPFLSWNAILDDYHRVTGREVFIKEDDHEHGTAT